jgi:hypothetical protein
MNLACQRKLSSQGYVQFFQLWYAASYRPNLIAKLARHTSENLQKTAMALVERGGPYTKSDMRQLVKSAHDIEVIEGTFMMIIWW